MSAPTVPIRRVPVALILPSRLCLVACSMSSIANSSIRKGLVAVRRVSRQRFERSGLRAHRRPCRSRCTANEKEGLGWI
jgi:hypothetical protein